MRTRWAVGAVVFALAAPAVAQDTAALDKLLCDALKEMHNKAADLYNAGDHNGCYRLFQGGLLTARPLLAHRPDVQRAIDDGLAAADRQASIPLRARQLHETIEAIRTRLKPPVKAADVPVTPPPPIVPSAPTPLAPGPALSPAPTAPPGPAATGDTLWKRLGGEDGVTKIVDRWLNLAAGDKQVNFTRGDKYKLDDARLADLKQRFVEYISSISSGTRVPASTKTMADVHKGMTISDKEFDSLVGLLKTSLETNKVAAADVDELLRKVNETKKDIVGR